jgi:hypothetical protein
MHDSEADLGGRFYIQKETALGQIRYRAVFADREGRWKYGPNAEESAMWDLCYAYQSAGMELTKQEAAHRDQLYQFLRCGKPLLANLARNDNKQLNDTLPSDITR